MTVVVADSSDFVQKVCVPRVPTSFSLPAQRPDDQIFKRADAHLYSILQ